MILAWFLICLSIVLVSWKLSQAQTDIHDLKLRVHLLESYNDVVHQDLEHMRYTVGATGVTPLQMVSEGGGNPIKDWAEQNCPSRLEGYEPVTEVDVKPNAS